MTSILRPGLGIAIVVAVLLGLVPMSPIGPTGPSPAAASSDCPEPSGGDTALSDVSAFSSSEHQVVISGGGWGHGVGMSQWGTFGAAQLGCTYEEILSTYYPGAVVEQRESANAPTVRIGLTNVATQATGQTMVATITADDGDLPWNLCEPGSECENLGLTQPMGERWRVHSRTEADPALVITRLVTDGSGQTTQEEVWRGGTASATGSTRLRAMHSGSVVTVRVGDLTRVFRWGFTQFEPHPDGDGRLYVVQHVTSGGGFSGMDRYLWGIAEVPSSWPTEALKVQAVAARSYATIRVATESTSRDLQCRCHMYSTVVNQVYTGWTKESQDATITNVDGVSAPWKHAVDATSGIVGVYRNPGHDLNGRIVDTFYSSSHGGKSDASRDVWGGDIPYLRSVDTSRWEDAVADRNRYHRWSVGFTATDIAARAGFHILEQIEVVRRTPGDRPTREDPSRELPNGLKITGYDADGRWMEKTFHGEGARSLLGTIGTGQDVNGQTITGIKSARFAITRHDVDGTPPPPPIDISAACPDGDFDRGAFPDVPVGVSHSRAIDCLAPAGWNVVRGQDDGNYNPLGNVGRGQMASFIIRSLERAGVELPEEPGQHFSDVEGTAHDRAINQLAELGLVDGYDDGTFRPGVPVTRAQMATFIAGMLTEVGYVLPEDAGSHFSDVGTGVHSASINKLAEIDVVRGTDHERRLYSPGRSVTRAQMASFIARSLNALVEEGHTERPF